MERTRQTLRVSFSRKMIVEINRRQIERFGGGWHPTPDNLQNPGTLEHVLEEIRGSVFGINMYPNNTRKGRNIVL